MDEVERMLRDLQPVLKACGKQCAVGGAVALAVHGVVRHTLDLDVFADEEIRPRLLRAVHERGYRIEPVYEPFHYAARPPWRTSSDEVRVDLLFPAAEPEFSGIVSAEKARPYKGVSVRVFNPVILALTRVYSDNPKHLVDLSLMLARGVLPIDDVREILSESDPAALRDFERKLSFITRRLAAPKRPKPGSFSRRLKSKGRE